MSIPKGIDALIIEVELKKCRDWLSYSYSGSGWHYLSALIKEYKKNPHLTYSQSILKTYYENFQPASLQEALFENAARKKHPISKGWPPLPWLKSPRKITKNYQHFGPNSDEFGEREFTRTLTLYHKLAQEGYQPDKYFNGYIKGYFLRYKNDYRFIVVSGQHRMAALGVLGYKRVRVRLKPHFPKCVDLKQAKRWVHVRNGRYSSGLAVEIFKLPFLKNGKERAKKLGLYQKIY